jgi:hypothetical protein
MTYVKVMDRIGPGIELIGAAVLVLGLTRRGHKGSTAG